METLSRKSSAMDTPADAPVEPERNPERNPLFRDLFILLTTSPFISFSNKLGGDQLDSVLLGCLCAILQLREWEPAPPDDCGRLPTSHMVPCLPTSSGCSPLL